MKKLILLALLASTSSFAEQPASMKCEGDYVQITAQSPYLGEANPGKQTLYTITQMVGGEYSTSQQTAYFLSAVMTHPDRATLMITGTNPQGGSFSLTIFNETKATITYQHGFMQAENAKLNCVRE